MEMVPVNVKTQSSSRDFNLINQLSDDLLLKILDQLPPKSAVQSKAVCKRWFCLISHPYFVQRHIHSHHHQDPVRNSFNLILDQNFEKQISKDSEFLQPSSINHLQILGDDNQLLRVIRFLHPKFSAVAYFNDLIVCRKGDFLPNVYYLCNPITRQMRMLPLPDPFFGQDNNSIIVGLVCYPHFCDEKQTCITNGKYSYKIVRVARKICIGEKFKVGGKFKVEIFCSESHEWRQSEVIFNSWRLDFRGTSNMIAYNGILHWLDIFNQVIVAYDPLNNKQKCRVINSPAHVRPNVQNVLGMCAGSLKICQLNNRLGNQAVRLSVWELEDYNEGLWRLEHEIQFDDVNWRNCLIEQQAEKNITSVRIVAFHPLDADVVYLNFPEGLVSCNVQTRTLELVCKLRNRPAVHLFPLVQRWWPTPVPPLPADELPY